MKLINNKQILIAILFFIIGVVVGITITMVPGLIRNSTPKTAQLSDNVPEKSSQQNTKFNVETIQENTTNQKIDIKYPQLITNKNNSTSLDFVNNAIKKIIEDELNTFNKGFREYNSQTGKFLPTSSPISDVQNTLYISFEIANLTDNIFSIEIQSQHYYAGMAHPAHYIFTYNYDFKKQKVINIVDLLSNPKSIDKLSSLTINKLEDKFKINGQFDETLANWIKEGASPNIENYKNILIKGKGTEVLFGEYQVASYADGQQRVFISYDEIKDIISPDYIFLTK